MLIIGIAAAALANLEPCETKTYVEMELGSSASDRGNLGLGPGLSRILGWISWPDGPPPDPKLNHFSLQIIANPLI